MSIAGILVVILVIFFSFLLIGLFMNNTCNTKAKDAQLSEIYKNVYATPTNSSTNTVEIIYPQVVNGKVRLHVKSDGGKKTRIYDANAGYGGHETALYESHKTQLWAFTPLSDLTRGVLLELGGGTGKMNSKIRVAEVPENIYFRLHDRKTQETICQKGDMSENQYSMYLSDQNDGQNFVELDFAHSSIC